MGKFIQISGIVYKKRERSRINPNIIDTEEGYTIVINSDFIHNLRDIKIRDIKGNLYMRYQVSTIANNSISGHYISKEHYDLLISTITTDADFGLIIIS